MILQEIVSLVASNVSTFIEVIKHDPSGMTRASSTSSTFSASDSSAAALTKNKRKMKTYT